MAYGIKEQECRLDLFKKHTGKYWRIFPYGKSVFKLKLVWRQA